MCLLEKYVSIVTIFCHFNKSHITNIWFSKFFELFKVVFWGTPEWISKIQRSVNQILPISILSIMKTLIGPNTVFWYYCCFNKISFHILSTANKIQHKSLELNQNFSFFFFLDLHGISRVSGKFPNFSIKGECAFHILNPFFFQISYKHLTWLK